VNLANEIDVAFATVFLLPTGVRLQREPVYICYWILEYAKSANCSQNTEYYVDNGPDISSHRMISYRCCGGRVPTASIYLERITTLRVSADKRHDCIGKQSPLPRIPLPYRPGHSMCRPLARYIGMAGEHTCSAYWSSSFFSFSTISQKYNEHQIDGRR
jgi:hypothetical protein